MDRTPAERTVSFRPTLVSPPPYSPEASTMAKSGLHHSMNTTNNNGTSINHSMHTATSNSNASASRMVGAVAPGYAQLSPTTGGLRVRRVASHRRLHGGSPGPGSRRAESAFELTAGTSPHFAPLLHRRAEDPLVSLVHRQHSVDSAMDATSIASPTLQSPVGAYPAGTLPSTLSRDSATMQELIALQQQQQQNMLKGVTVIYPQGASPLEPHMRMPDYGSMQEDAQSNGGDSANEDRVQVRVEGYYEGGNVNVLIPNDLPPSTLLYVLTASDGRDLMFKLTQYTLQLAICFLKMPSLFSPEVQVFTGPWAERLYRNYNTIRHGRSLFKMGRGLLNLFTVQTVCERLWMKYEGDLSRHTCAVLLPIVSRMEKALLMLGASPVWGRALSRQLLHWSQAAELTPGQWHLEESQDSMSMDWRIQERMKSGKHAAHLGALLADDTFTHVAEVERSGTNANAAGGGGGGGGGAGTGFLHSMMNSGSLTNSAIQKAMHAMGFAVPRSSTNAGGGGNTRGHNASLTPPSQPVLPRSPADEQQTSEEPSAQATPHTQQAVFPNEDASTSAPAAAVTADNAVAGKEEDATAEAVDHPGAPVPAAVVAAAEASEKEKEKEKTEEKSAVEPPGSRLSPPDSAAATPAPEGAARVAEKTGSSDVAAAGDAATTAPASPDSALLLDASGKRVDPSTSTSMDDDDANESSARPFHNRQQKTPPFVHGTMPLILEHELLPGMALPKHTAATQPTLASYDADSSDTNNADGGRMTLLRPLPRPTHNSSTTDPDCSMMGDDAFAMRLDGTLHEDTSSMLTVAAPTATREPMSMPDNWRPAMAPTVPPSQADEFDYAGPTMSFPAQPSTLPLPAAAADRNARVAAQATAAAAAAAEAAATTITGQRKKKTLVSEADTDSAVGAGSTREASPLTTETKERAKKSCPPFELVPVLAASASQPTSPAAAAAAAAAAQQATPVSLLQSASSSLSALARQKSANEVANESDMSHLSSEANSSFHVRPSGASGAMTTWLNELQPASAALPARVRKGILQFNPLLMTLLGIRSLAAALRRFLRDATLVSSERFINFTLVETHRRTIMRFINRCWLIISVIDLLLNTVRLLQPGWVKYATARQNIRCRCGCQGDEDPADTVWRTHGFIARRKTDLFFPPLNLDYGAPFVSYVSYMEAADPARLMPACSRCGCLYKEIPAEAEFFEGVREAPSPLGIVPLTAVEAASLNRAGPAAHASMQSETPVVLPMSRLSQSVSEEGDRSLSHGAAEREKPRWVQMYEAEVQEAGEARRRSVAAAAESKSASSNVGLGARRETQKPSSTGQINGSADDASGSVMPELADLAVSPQRNSAAVHTDNNAGRSMKVLRSRDTNDLMSSLNGVGSGVMTAQHEEEGARQHESATGILFVPWMMRKFFDYVWLLRVHPNLTATLLLEVRYLAEFYLSYKYCFGGYETYAKDAPLSNILHPYGALAGMVSAAVGLLRVMESAPTV